jgi:peptidoglycan/xylan/chitin deacetylase (PgdA/CDA1 family)
MPYRPHPRRFAKRLLRRLANLVDAPRLVLTWHRVAILPEDPWQLAVRPDHFSEQIAILSKLARVVPLTALIETPAPAVAITFDDGYADNLYEVLPTLERTGSPATFFITTGLMDAERESWSDALARILASNTPPCCDIGSPLDRPWPATTDEDRRALLAHLDERLHQRAPEVIAEAMARLHMWSGVPSTPRATHRRLNADEVARLAAHPLVTVGAHTVNHPCLAALSSDRQRYELGDNRDHLRRITGQTVDTVAYPFGTWRRDVKPATRAIARELGFTHGVLSDSGQVHRWSDPLCLPRQTVRDWNGDEFARHLAEFWHS